MKKKNLFALGLFAVAFCCAAGGVYVSQSKVSAEEITPQTAEFVMTKGASVRLKEGENGIRFMASLTPEEYTAIEGAGASYGMLIAPADYVEKHDLTVENVFGENAVYDWAVEDENGGWGYEGDGSKTRIINLTYDELDTEGGNYVVRGSVTNVLESNITRGFVGRAYIRYGAEGDYAYEMADYPAEGVADVTRSMYDVAAAAIADTGENAPTAEQKRLLTEEYTADVWLPVSDLTSPGNGSFVTNGFFDSTNVTNDLSNDKNYVELTALPDNVGNGYLKYIGYSASPWGFYDIEKMQESLSLSDYYKLRFYTRNKIQIAGNWVGTGNNAGSPDENWVTFDLEKQADDTWNLYIDGVEKKTGITKLSELTMNGSGWTYISDLYGIRAYGYEEICVTSMAKGLFFSPTTVTGSGTDQSVTTNRALYAGEPLEGAEAFPRLYQLKNAWNSYQCNDIDLDEYDELSFYLTGTGSYVEVGDSANRTNHGNGLIQLKREEDGWTLYVNGVRRAAGIQKFSQLYVRVGGSSPICDTYISDLIGVKNFL